MNAEHHGVRAIVFEYDSVTQSSSKGDLSLTRLLGSASHTAGEEHAEALSSDRRKKQHQDTFQRHQHNEGAGQRRPDITCSMTYTCQHSMQKIGYTFTCI